MFLAFGIVLIVAAVIGFVILGIKAINNMKGPRVFDPSLQAFDSTFSKHLDLMKVGAVLFGVFILGGSS